MEEEMLTMVGLGVATSDILYKRFSCMSVYEDS